MCRDALVLESEIKTGLCHRCEEREETIQEIAAEVLAYGIIKTKLPHLLQEIKK